MIRSQMPEGVPSAAVSNDLLASWAQRLALPALGAGDRQPEMTAAELIDRAQLLEHLSSAIAAEQARTASQFAQICLRQPAPGEGEPHGPRATDRDRRARVRSAGAQIALARRAAPSRGMRIVELSEILVREMPLTLRALAEGALTEARAFAVAATTLGLVPEHRADVDRRLCGQPARLAHLGDRALEDAARQAVEEIDHGTAAERIRRAEAERHVTIRRLPDAMATVTAILPVAGAIVVRDSLMAAAETAKAAGDERSLGQLTADALIERVTGLADAGRIPLRVGLVMTDRALLAGASEPATLPGYGTVPADWARELVDRALSWAARPAGDQSAAARERVWLERLFTAPESGQLVAMDSKARLFPTSMGRFLRLRDGRCRSPFCDAPPRHLDHVVPFAEGGPTALGNGQCLCAFCNLAKEAPGWQQRVVDPGPVPAGPHGSAWVTPFPRSRRGHLPGRVRGVGPLEARTSKPPGGTRLGQRAMGPGTRHTVETETPTGHTYRSTPPALPGSARP